MVKMLQTVMLEMIPFIVIFILALILFSFVFTSLGFHPELLEDYQKLPKLGALLIWTLRSSLADFDISLF